MDGQTGNELGAEEIHVPARLTKYHRVARQFRDRTDLQQISRKALPRALRIIHALALEIERRGHEIECADAVQTDRYGRRERNAKASAQFVVTIKDHGLELRIYEKGVGLRSAWEKQKAYYEENRLNFRLGYLPSRPTAYDKDASGQLNISLLGHGPRQTTWGDRKRWKLDDRLGQVLRELETQAVEAEERRLARERREAERQRQWEAAMADAKRRFIEDHQLDVLRRRVQAWQEADAIRAYCDAVEARHGQAATEADTAAWLQLAREHADRLQRLPTMPAEPEITNESLKPYLGPWSPYGPRGW